MIVTIIGLGLIGGSLAIDLRNSGFAKKIIGVDNNENHVETALELGIVDEALSLEDAAAQTDLILVAIPVDATRKALGGILDLVRENTVVADMGSTKAGICKAIENHPKRSQFVASHPIAGTENSGPTAAIPNLFRGKTIIICEREKSSSTAISVLESMYAHLLMKVNYMGAEEHDLHIAYVSHLSHISSFTLGLTVLDIEKNEQQIFDLAGSGFASTVRLAKSSPDMWAPIFEQNADYLVNALDTHIKYLIKFKESIEANDRAATHQLMQKANEIRRVLEGIELKEQQLGSLSSSNEAIK